MVEGCRWYRGDPKQIANRLMTFSDGVETALNRATAKLKPSRTLRNSPSAYLIHAGAVTPRTRSDPANPGVVNALPEPDLSRSRF